MRSLLAFWMGGAASTSFIAPVPKGNIFRVDQTATGGDLYRISPGDSGKIFRT